MLLPRVVFCVIMNSNFAPMVYADVLRTIFINCHATIT